MIMRLFFMVLATISLMLVSFPSPVHAGYEELLKDCKVFASNPDKAKRVLESCNELIEQYDMNYSKITPKDWGKIFWNMGYAMQFLGEFSSAMFVFKRACELENGDGCYEVGMAYYDGRGVTRSRSQAATFMEKGCKAGKMEACGMLPLMK